MKIELLTQAITLALLTTTAILQLRNYLKYRLTNGANVIRVVLFLTNLMFIIHTVRLMLGIPQGYFFTAGIVFLFYLYTRDWIRDKLKI